MKKSRVPSERSWNTSGRFFLYSSTRLQSGEWTTRRFGQELPPRRKVCSGIRSVPLPRQGSDVGGQFSRSRNTGASSSQVGGTISAGVFGTDRPRSPGKYQRTPTKRSRNSYTPQSVPSERTG